MLRFILEIVVLFFASRVIIIARLVDPVCMQGPIPGVRSSSCCDMPNFLWPDLVETCTDKVLNDKDSPMDMAYGITQEDVLFAPGIRCIANCILNNETGFYHTSVRNNDTIPASVKYTVNVAELGRIIDVSFNDSEHWVPVLKQALEMCASAVATTRFEDSPDDECPMLGAFFMACIDTKAFELCPKEAWHDEYGCADLRQQAKRCPVSNAVLHD